MFLVNPNSTRHPVAHPVHLHGHHYSVLSTGNSLSSNQNFPFLQPPLLCPLQGPSLLRTRLPGSKSKICLGQFLETSTIHLAKIQCKLHQDLTLWSGEKWEWSESYIFDQILHWQPWLLVDSLSYQFWPHRGAGIAIWFNPNLIFNRPWSIKNHLLTTDYQVLVISVGDEDQWNLPPAFPTTCNDHHH